MKLTPAAEFAVRGAIVLAEQYGQGPVTLDTICAVRSLSKQYLTKIFASLARANLVVPIRGKHGGFTLARDPSQITLLEVIEAVEGPIVMNFCQHVPSKCERVDCTVRPIWADVQKLVRGKLSSVTLKDCAQQNNQPQSPQTEPAEKVTVK